MLQDLEERPYDKQYIAPYRPAHVRFPSANASQHVTSSILYELDHVSVFAVTTQFILLCP